MSIPAAYSNFNYGTFSNDNGSAAGSAAADMAAAKKRIQDLTEGRAGELANDPYQKSVMDFLQGVTNGSQVPFTNEVQGAILAQQGKGSADAEAAQMANLRESMGANGGSIYDPSYQAAAREAMSQRQGRNLDAAGNMAANAGQANFNARMSGAGQLANARNAQNAQVNQLGLAGAGYRAMESREVGGGGVPVGGGSRAPAPTWGGPDQFDLAAINSNGGTPAGQFRQVPMVRGSGVPQQTMPIPQPQQTTSTQPGGVVMPTNDPQTDAEKKRAGSYRLADIQAGTGPYAPSTPSRY